MHKANSGNQPRKYRIRYFPEWQQNLAIPQSGQREGSFIFTVALGKDLWRRIAIPHHNTLEDLSNEILAAYEFDHDHLYEFIYADHSGISQRAFHPYMEESPTTHEVKIGTLPLREGATMVYHYDFGDDWRFDVMLEKVDAENEEITKPTLLEKHGEAPQQYPDYDDDGW